MKTLKNMIMESSKNLTSKKTLEIEMTCKHLRTKNVYSDYNVDYYNEEDDEEDVPLYKEKGYSSADEAFVEEENEFGFDSEYELTLTVDGNELDSVKCTIHAVFGAENNDYWLIRKDTDIDFYGAYQYGFSGEEVARLIYNAIDNDNELWSELYKEFGYKKNEEPHELVYGRPFEEELCDEIADAWNWRVSKIDN